uniref:Uncharacterized protein n=1 Tax=Vitrella brassicaformis TaxID=1169539 RepID=A0A7S1JVU2_9ALVE|mmetsp:Transcript_25915/g.64388  ORF Transcript_25915/g.64388 Transcript_25915/m.64388 type:complete len:373 (+) Transcript_25915:375-1493(+)
MDPFSKLLQEWDISEKQWSCLSPQAKHRMIVAKRFEILGRTLPHTQTPQQPQPRTHAATITAPTAAAAGAGRKGPPRKSKERKRVADRHSHIDVMAKKKAVCEMVVHGTQPMPVSVCKQVSNAVSEGAVSVEADKAHNDSGKDHMADGGQHNAQNAFVALPCLPSDRRPHTQQQADEDGDTDEGDVFMGGVAGAGVGANEMLVAKRDISGVANALIDEFRQREGLLGPNGNRIKGFQVNWTTKYRCFAVYWQQRDRGRRSKFFRTDRHTYEGIREALELAIVFRNRCRQEGSLPGTPNDTNMTITGGGSLLVHAHHQVARFGGDDGADDTPSDDKTPQEEMDIGAIHETLPHKADDNTPVPEYEMGEMVPVA